MFSGTFLTQKGIQHLKDHKYSAGEISPLDRFISGKMSSVVELFPKNLAPNMITLIGTIAQFSSSLLFFLHSSSFADARPAYTYFYAALVLFFYQLMDISDGKQARRIKKSTPLGQLFDHGLDCIVTSSIGYNICILYQVGDRRLFLCSAVLIVVGIFYFANWAEHFTGQLVTAQNGFGIIEIHYIIIFQFFLTGVLGPQIWSAKIFGIDLKNYLVVIYFAAVFNTNYSIIKGAYQAAQNKRYFFMSLFPVASYVFCVIVLFQNRRIMYCLNSLFFACLFIYNLNCIKLIISTMTKQRFKKMHTEMIVLYAFTLAISVVSFSNTRVNFLGKLFFLCSVSMLLEFSVNISKQIAKELGIRVLFV